MIRLYLKYLRYLKPYAYILVLIFFADVMVTSFGLITPLFSRILFDYAYPLREVFILNIVIIAMALLFFIEFFMNVCSDYISTYVDQSVTLSLTKKLFYRCQNLSLNFHFSKTPGDLVKRFTDDIDTVVSKCIETIPAVIIQLYFLISILVIAFFMNWKITGLALLSVPIYILETKFFSKKEELIQEEHIDLNSKYLDVLQEKFKNIRTIKAFGAEKAETDKVVKHRSLMNVVAIKHGLVSIISVFANSITIKIWSMFLGWYMGYLVIHRELTVGEIIALLAYVAMISAPVQELALIFTNLRVAMVSFRRLDELMAEPLESNIQNKNDFKIKDGTIRFENVNFTYGKDENKILDELSFQLKGKACVAIVGESGSGKSTIISLLMRFYDAQDGCIFIDGQNISEVGLRTLRGQIGLVQQDFTLFAGTLRENIMYGNEDRNEEQLIQACKKAQIYDFIKNLEDGFDSQIGFGGEGLSGGQKQRIAIARVLLKDSPIIIFDEATSALDPESEFKITEVMDSLIGKKNILIIAHRLSTIKKVDVILMLEKGKIVEQGSFENLLNKKGVFFKYYSMQFGGFDVFKKILEVEYERVSRYHSSFNLVAVRENQYHEISAKEGKDIADQFMLDLSLIFKKVLRKGDNSARFGDDIILVLLPEIKENGVKEFCERITEYLNRTKVRVAHNEFSIHVEFYALHLEQTPFVTVEDLISKCVSGLDLREKTQQNYQIDSIKGDDKIG